MVKISLYRIFGNFHSLIIFQNLSENKMSELIITTHRNLSYINHKKMESISLQRQSCLKQSKRYKVKVNFSLLPGPTFMKYQQLLHFWNCKNCSYHLLKHKFIFHLRIYFRKTLWKKFNQSNFRIFSNISNDAVECSTEPKHDHY